MTVFYLIFPQFFLVELIFLAFIALNILLNRLNSLQKHLFNLQSDEKNYIRYPIIILMHSPYTLFTCHIPSFILLITSSRFHITHHITSHITHHNTSHPTSQFTHHHINTMTTSHSPADDGRNISSESSCYILFYYVFT